MFHPSNPFSHVPSGWLTRQTRAREKLAKARDPKALLVRAVRAGMAAQDEARQDAERDFAELHRLVVSPLPEVVHPQVAERVRAFLAEAGINDPLVALDGETLPAMIDRYAAKAKSAHDEAVEALRRHEVAKARAVVEEAAAKLEAIERAGADPADVVVSGETNPVEDESIAADEKPKRRPGRPRITEAD